MHTSNFVYFHGGGSLIKTTPPPSPPFSHSHREGGGFNQTVVEVGGLVHFIGFCVGFCVCVFLGMRIFSIHSILIENKNYTLFRIS